jgi:hypothetical protein
MGPLIYWPPLAHLAILLALGAVCLFRLEDMPPLPNSDMPPVPPAVTASAHSTLFPLPEVGVYDGVLAAMDGRPLFTAGRRLAQVDGAVSPPSEARASEGQTGATGLDLKLMAVISQGAKMRALVVTMDGNEELWVQEGDDLAGWQVTAIGQRTLALQLGERTVTFDMFD